MDPLLAAAGAAVLLVALWAGANRRHLARRAPQQREWGEAGRRPDLWTSAARCPSCGHTGGLLSAGDEEDLWYSCLGCGQRHRREHRA